MNNEVDNNKEREIGEDCKRKEEKLKKKHTDLYLLTNLDLSWEEDPQREHPHLRDWQ